MAAETGRARLNPDWAERFLGGSEETERRLLERFAEQINEVQVLNRRRDQDPIRRAFHAKLLAGVANATFTVAPDLRPELQAALFVPGATHPALVRFSNASGTVRSDAVRDLRGVAVRIGPREAPPAEGAVHDLLFSNTRTSHSRDAVQFMASAVAMAGGRRIRAIPGLVRRLGFGEGLRVFRALRRSASRKVGSLATEAYFGRLPFAVGSVAVKFALQPMATDQGSAQPHGPEGLRQEFVDRLALEDVRYRLEALHFVDEATTPIEDATVEWTPGPIASDPIGELLLPRQDLTTGDGPAGERLVEATEFTPWNCPPGIRPIGSLNRARQPVYEASVRLRSGHA
jgi:Catalase